MPNAEPAMTANPPPFRILSLDGGGAKGFYTLGVLREIEAMVDRPLHTRFDLIFGTSTGAIIAGLLALGRSVDEIHALYKEHVPTIMRSRTSSGRSAALRLRQVSPRPVTTLERWTIVFGFCLSTTHPRGSPAAPSCDRLVWGDGADPCCGGGCSRGVSSACGNRPDTNLIN